MKFFSKLVSLLLCLCLLVSLVPTALAARGAQADAVQTVWEQISAVEAVNDALPTALRTTSTAEQVYRFAMQSDYVDSASVRYRGKDKVEFVTVDGEPCLYSTQLREKLRAAEANDPDAAETETIRYAKKGGSPTGSDVYLIEPYYGLDDSFTEQYQNEGKSIAQATGGTYHLYAKNEATVDHIAQALESGGVVIFDSHGDTDYADGEDYVSGATTSYLCLQTGTGITAADKVKDGDTYHYYYGGGYDGMQYYLVDGTVLANHMEKQSGNALLWSAICLGMATDGLQKPLREKGLGVAYGYSQSVTFDYDYLWEAAFFSKLKSGATVAESIAYMKQKVGNWDQPDTYSTISAARRNYAAFPIVASDEDVYPGHGNVDDLQTVNSTWTLLSKVTIQAVSGDPAHGSVSVSGNVITAEPAEGYYASGASVIAGTASVTQNGNRFVVNAQSDCTVRIDFAAKTKATLRFAVPDGMEQTALEAYVGDSVTLPRPSGQITMGGREYSFCGWVKQRVADTMEAPSYYPAGESYLIEQADTELIALFTYDVSQQGGGNQDYERLTQEQANYSGEYVLRYDKQKLALDGGLTDAGSYGSRTATVTLEASAGRVRAENGDPYRFTLIKAANGYLLRSNSGYYLYSDQQSGNSLSATAQRAVAEAYPLTVSGQRIYSTAGAELQYNLINHDFKFYFSGVTDTVSLYRKGGTGVDLYYTTELTDAHVHRYTETVTAPTCTERGYTTHTCDCGESYVDSYVDALGHAYAVTDEVAATEEHGGYTVHTCSRCGDNYRDNETAPLSCPSAGYVDLDRSKWYHTGVDFVLANGYMSSTGDGVHFSPDMALTRAMLVQILYAKEGAPEVSEITRQFRDVDAAAWYARAVTWAAERGIVAGYSDGRFGVGDPVSREQIAVILYAYAGADSTDTGSLSAFPDAKATHSWAEKQMAWAVANGLFAGAGDGRLLPQGTATRAQFAVIFRAFLLK